MEANDLFLASLTDNNVTGVEIAKDLGLCILGTTSSASRKFAGTLASLSLKMSST